MTHRRGGFLDAVGLLTRFPVSSSGPGNSGTAWFPVVGALIGLTGAAIYWLAQLVIPSLLAAVTAVAGLIALTGALHEDGLADYADALGSGAERSRALKVMHDPRVGVFGAIALVISLAWRIAAVSALEPVAAAAGLAMTHALARSGAAVLSGALPPVRPTGLGRSIAETSLPRERLVAALGGLSVAVAASGAWALLAMLLTAAAVIAVRRSAVRTVGGLTGDVLGACEQLIEVLVLTMVVAAARVAPSWWDGLL